MKRRPSLLYPLFVFVVAQLAWFLVVGLWIYRYVVNNMIFEQVGENLSPRLISRQENILALVAGLILMVSVSVALSLIFRHLTIHLKMTRMYDNFIANVTHALKSPLASIQLYLETLQTRSVPDAQKRQFLDIMLNDAGRLQKLIDTILDISGLEQNKFVYRFQVVKAGTAFKKMVEEAAAQFKLSDESIVIGGEASCSCVMDCNAMRIVFDNLIDNAIKYSVLPPEIRVNFSRSANHVLIEFRDHGIGILPKDQKRIFQKFQRLYGRDIPNVKGAGIGLSWVREIVKAHGGNISVESEGRGKGTAFFIQLPVYRTGRRHYIHRLLEMTRKRQAQQGIEHENE